MDFEGMDDTEASQNAIGEALLEQEMSMEVVTEPEGS